MKKIYTLFSMVLLIVMVTAGCGSKEAATHQEGTQQEEKKLYVLKDARTTHEFEKLPERIVVLQWQQAENLLALGIQPVGFADIPNWNLWVNIDKKLADSVVDVGNRVEPSMEAIAELNPDLIIGTLSWHEGYLNQLEAIAPTALFDTGMGADANTEYDAMLNNFNTFAEFFGKEAEAKKVHADLEKALNDGRQRIADLKLLTDQFVAAMAYSGSQAPEFRLYNNKAQISVIMEKMGLNNAIEQPKQDGTFDKTNVESLSAFKDVLFLYIVQDADNVFKNVLAGTKVWEDLEFVQKNQLYGLGGDSWTQGGPLSAITLAHKTVEALEKVHTNN